MWSGFWGGLEGMSSESSAMSSISTGACFRALFSGNFADAQFEPDGAFKIFMVVVEGTVFFLVRATVTLFFTAVSAAITLFFTVVPDFCLFCASCGSPFVVALVDSLHL